MKNLVIILALFYFACSSPNKLINTPIDKIDSLIFKNEISKYQISNDDTLIDIGSGYGLNDRIIFKFYPNLFFVLEDIDVKYLREDRFYIWVNGSKTYFKERCKRIIGTPDTIPVGSGKYKNVLCRITLHEFTNTPKMLSELKRILAPNGQVIIVERIPKFHGEIDKVCNKKLLNGPEIVELFSSNGFNLISFDSTDYSDERFGGNASIFRFSK